MDCPEQTLSNERAVAVLVAAGLRPTAQRVILTCLLFCKGTYRHTTAEELYARSIKAGCKVSLATVYNTLHSFTKAGIIRQIATDSTKVYFDTNPEEHYHFYDESTGELINIHDDLLKDLKLPPLPKGAILCSVDLLVRIRS
ncbi:MAG: hypothetical protein COA84_04535 [Robiginitomaculum sp.]|nr:MAG: hypothetical protein COA84_04535 [Robiginitomaculum sp.]